MNIHEYQAKALLRSYGAPVSDGRVVLRERALAWYSWMFMRGPFP